MKKTMFIACDLGFLKMLAQQNNVTQGNRFIAELLKIILKKSQMILIPFYKFGPFIQKWTHSSVYC